MTYATDVGAQRDLGNGVTVPVVTSTGFSVNPSSLVLTRPADTNAYAANDLVANSTTAGSVVVPSVSVMRLAGGSGTIPKVTLFSNHTTGLSGISMTVHLWSAAPTYTNGDNGAYAVATGAAGFLGKYTGTFEQFGDGAVCRMTPYDGVVDVLKLASGQLVYWDLQTNAIFTPISGATFTLVPQVLQD
jgi:hypothetical protein